MKKKYENPEIQIRNYVTPARDIIMTSDGNLDENNKPGLNDGEDVSTLF